MKHVISLALTTVLLTSGASAREIALSFDDAPRGATASFTGPERTEILISALETAGVEQVVFFCITGRLPRHGGVERLQRYSDAGHLIANHTHTHSHPHELGAAGYLDDVVAAHHLLKDFATFVPWFRYPFLDEGRTYTVRDSLRDGLRAMAYSNGYVTVDTYDWHLDRRYRDAVKEGISIDTAKLRELYVEVLCESATFYDSMAVQMLGRSPKHVILLHENDLAAMFTGALVDGLRDDGWRIISPKAAYQDSIAVWVPDVLMNNQGRVAAIAAELGVASELRSPGEDATRLDSLLAARRVFGGKLK